MRLHLAQRRRGGKLAGGCALQICSCHPQKWSGRCQVWQPQGLDPGRARPAALARPGGFGARSPRLLPEFRAALPSRGLSKLETPSWGGQGGIFQPCSPVLLWQGKARIDGNTSSFIWIAGNPRLPERKGSDTFPLPHISPFSSTTENLAVWISTFIYKANDNAEQNYGSNQWLKYYLPRQIIYHCSLPLFFSLMKASFMKVFTNNYI